MFRFIFLFCLIFLGNSVQGQTTVRFNQLWTQLVLNASLNEDLTLNMDGGTRYQDIIKTHFQTFVRADVSARILKKYQVGLGYAFFHTQTENPSPSFNAYENRIYQDVNFSNRLFDRNLSHRFRFEERFFSGSETNASFMFRPRYMFKYSIGLQKTSPNLFVEFADEIMLAFGDHVSKSHVEQNRVYLGLKYQTQSNQAITIGYQYAWQATTNDLIDNQINAFRVAFSTKL